MNEKSLFEKAQDMLKKGTPRRTDPVSEFQRPPHDETPGFNLNISPSPAGKVPGGQPFIPSGTQVMYRSPLFGLLEAEVMDDQGACVWIWHPIRECEASIPRGWIEKIEQKP